MRATQIETIEKPTSASALQASDLMELCRVHGLDAGYLPLLREILELEDAGLLTLSPDPEGELRVRITALGIRSTG